MPAIAVGADEARPCAGSQLRALETSNPGPWIIGHELPTLSPRPVRGANRAVIAHPLTQVFPLGQRRGLLRARRRDNEPSRRASNRAASNENERNSEASNVHRARLARFREGVKRATERLEADEDPSALRRAGAHPQPPGRCCPVPRHRRSCASRKQVSPLNRGKNRSEFSSQPGESD